MLFTETASQSGTQTALYRDARIEITHPFSNIIDAGQTTSAGLNLKGQHYILGAVAN